MTYLPTHIDCPQLPKKFDQKKILKVIKKKFACNGKCIQSTNMSHSSADDKFYAGTIVNDSEMGEVIQLQGDQRKDVQEFLIDKKEGLELDAKTIKVCDRIFISLIATLANQMYVGSRLLNASTTPRPKQIPLNILKTKYFQV